MIPCLPVALSILVAGSDPASPDIPRIAVKARAIPARELSPPGDSGGFLARTLLSGTLVRRDSNGEFIPGLAIRREHERSGTSGELDLRDDATDQDGSPVDEAQPASAPPRPAMPEDGEPPQEATGPAPTQAPPADAGQDPAQHEVLLPTAAADWRASLILDNGDVGIWTVKPFQVLPQYGCPEVVGVDDKGRCLVMVSYSGKWSPNVWIHDGKWLGGLTHGDVDPRVPGAELYTGGQKGNLYMLTGSPQGPLEARRIGWIPGHEIHTLLVDPFRRTDEPGSILAFTRPGGLYRLRADAPDGGFTVKLMRDLPGRVRDALVFEGDHGPVIATVSRAGHLELIESMDGTLRWSTLYEAPMGMGRLALRRASEGEPVVLYSTLDDGRVMRHEQQPEGWSSETIFLGPQGMRGVASGRFHEDPSVESVAVFGYSAKVQMLSRRPGEPWQVETVFVDRDRGHWLSTAELDGRNGTDELVASGYGGRIVLLSRPVGYGLPPQIARDGE